MCEIVVMLDPKGNAKYDIGDVLEVRDDGWQWGKLELANPNWRIIKLPGVPVSEYQSMCDPVVVRDISGTITDTVKYCSGQIDVSVLSGVQKGQVLTTTDSALTVSMKDALEAQPVNLSK